MTDFPFAGPTGLGTRSLRLRSRPSPEPESEAEPEPEESDGERLHIPELYCPDAVRDDVALGEEVNERLVEWAAEIGIYEGRLERLRSHNFGRLFMLAHPGTDDADRILAAARCGLAEWSVDDHWVDEGEDTDPNLLGTRIALVHAVTDPVRLPPKYQGDFEQVVQREPVLRAFRSAFGLVYSIASPVQVARLRHEVDCMLIGYSQEAEWRASGHQPAVWEYLLHRYENAFYPCMVLIDPVDGYELPATEFADIRVRRVYLYAGVANVLLNDVYSMHKEDPTDTNLPTVIAAEEKCSLQDAIYRAAAIHDEMMHTIEAECAALSKLGSPQLSRYVKGLWNWMGGSKEWHATSPRYNGES